MEIIQKSLVEGEYDLEYVIKFFENTNDLAEIKSVVSKARDRVFCSWATVDVVDSQYEKIPIEDVIEQTENWIKNRGGVLLETHTPKIVGRVLSYKILKNEKTNTKGVIYLAIIYKGIKIDDVVWDKIQKGQYKGLSIGGVKDGVEYKENHTEIKGFKQFEASVCGAPANPYATFIGSSVVAKSLKNINFYFNLKKDFNMSSNLKKHQK